MKPLQRIAAVAALICAAGLCAACNKNSIDPPPETTSPLRDVTDEVTSPETQTETTQETEAMTLAETESVTDAVTEPVTEPETECHVLFEDDFNGPTLDTAKWTVGTAEDQPEVRYNLALWDPALVETDGEGHLLLRMEWDAEGKVARSGAITTKGIFETDYGYLEASILFPVTYARTCTFALTNGQSSVNVITTSYGKDGVNYRQGSGLLDKDPLGSSMESVLVNLYDGRFHTVGLLRAAEGHTFYIDGRETAFVPAADLPTDTGDNYLALFWEALKNDGAGRNENENSIPAALKVDYVRVWSSLPATLGSASNGNATVVFNDDFDGAELDNSKWEKCPEWDRQGKSRWQNDMSYLDGEGNLVLKMEWNKDTQLVDCGAVRTAGRFSYGYGYYEARIKFTSHYGAWGAFWMMCGNVGGIGNGAADGVEIDILESIDNQNGIYNHNLHWDGYGAEHQVATPELITKVNIYDGEYHTFGLLRNESGYAFYIDGHLSGIKLYKDCLPCPENGYIKLTCESAEWSGGGSPECIADLPGEMIVDYVRVWDTMPDLQAGSNP